MNTRCYRCGWNFSLSREAVEAAVTEAATLNEKSHVVYCPKCRQSIKLPIDQLKRTVRAVSTPPSTSSTPPANDAAA